MISVRRRVRLLLVQPDLEDMQELADMRAEIMDHVNMVMNAAAEYKATFDAYSYLWTDDRHEFMRQFLLYNHVLTAEEIEAHAEDGLQESPPSLKQFRDQVTPVREAPLFDANILHTCAC